MKRQLDVMLELDKANLAGSTVTRPRILSQYFDEEEADEESSCGSEASAATSNSANASIEKMEIDTIKDGGDVSPRKRPAELFRTDYITAMKVPDHETFDQSNCLVITDPWRNEWNKGVQVPVRSAQQILTPSFAFLSSKEGTKAENQGKDNFRLPKKLLRTTKDDQFDSSIHQLTHTLKDAEAVCRYDLDDCDQRWLKMFNRKRLELGLEPLLESLMEKCIESFETLCFEHLAERKSADSIIGVQFDEDTVCDVCQLPDSEENNEMIFCDACNVAVHQVCYGIVQVPHGPWFCRPCAIGVKPACMLCPNRGGAMKSTRSGQRFCHVICGLWIPEAGFADAELMEPIINISSIPEERWLLRCNICHQRSGACIQCSARNCRASYHVTCAQRQTLTMRIEAGETKKDEVKMVSFCKKHSTDSLSPKRITKESAAAMKAKRVEELEDEFFVCVKPSEEMLNKLPVSVFDVESVYEYWKLKRKSRFNAPLMKAKVEEEQLMQKMHEDVLYRKCRARNLCYMIVRREKLRKRLFSTLQDAFTKQSVLLSSETFNPSPRDYSNCLKCWQRCDASVNANALPTAVSTSHKKRRPHSCSPVESTRNVRVAESLRATAGNDRSASDPLNCFDLDKEKAAVQSKPSRSSRVKNFSKAATLNNNSLTERNTVLPNGTSGTSERKKFDSVLPMNSAIKSHVQLLASPGALGSSPLSLSSRSSDGVQTRRTTKVVQGGS